MRPAFILACLLCAVIACRAERSFAQASEGALLVAPTTDAPPDLLERALHAAKVQLDGAGMPLKTLDDPGCDLACAVTRLAQNQSKMAVQLELWVPRGFRERGSLAVTLKDARGSAVGRGRFEHADGDQIESAMNSALDQALARWPTRGGSMIRVDGTPVGATFIIDRDPEQGGTLPSDLRITPGQHVISVSHYGYEEHEETFTVPSHLDDPMQLRIELTPAPSGGAGAAGSDKAASSKRWLHIAGPTTLAVLGATGLVLGALGLSRDGECEERSPTGACIEKKRANVGVSFGYTVAGAAAVAAAVGWGIWAIVDAREDKVLAGVRVPIALGAGKNSPAR